METVRGKELLITENLRNIDIAMECGYTNERSFHRAFLQMTGMTPGAYRNFKRNTDPVDSAILPHS